MEYLNFLDKQLMVTGSIILFGVFAAMLFAGRTRKQAVKMVEKSLKLQEENNRHLVTIIQELKRSYRTLCMLADVEPEDINLNQGHGQETGAGAADITSQTKLYVGNIDYAATEAELADHFARFGRIEFVNIPINRYNGRARGFGFVTFTSIQDAERAMVLNGSEFKGRQIQVNFAKERD